MPKDYKKLEEALTSIATELRKTNELMEQIVELSEMKKLELKLTNE